MANKGSVLQGLYEKIVLKAISRLTYDSAGNLRVSNTPTGTQTISGAVTLTSTTITASSSGVLSQIGTSQLMTQQTFQQSFRRNLAIS